MKRLIPVLLAAPMFCAAQSYYVPPINYGQQPAPRQIVPIIKPVPVLGQNGSVTLQNSTPPLMAPAPLQAQRIAQPAPTVIYMPIAVQPRSVAPLETGRRAF